MNSFKQKEDAVFYKAMNLTDPARRKVFSDQTCAENDVLRYIVKEKLAACAYIEGFFFKVGPAICLLPEEFRNIPADVGMPQHPPPKVAGKPLVKMPTCNLAVVRNKFTPPAQLGLQSFTPLVSDPYQRKVYLRFE